MAFEALRASIETKFALEWGVTTEIAWENISYEPDNAPWVRLTVGTGVGYTLGIDGTLPTVRDTGVIMLQIFTPEGTGTKVNKELLDTALPIYEHTRFDGILVYTATVTQAGISNGWYQTNVTFPFRRVRNV